MRTRILTLVTLLVSTLACLGFLELGVRVIMPQTLLGVWSEPGPLGMDYNASKGSVRHKAGDVDVRYQFSAPHLRGPAPDPSACHILVFGASFTFGWLLNDEDTFVRRLEKAANADGIKPRIQLLNASVPAGRVSSALAYLQEYGDAVAPSAVLYVFDGNNFNRADFNPGYRLEPDGTLSVHQAASRPKVSNITRLRLVRWLAEHSHLFQLTKNLALGYLGHGGFVLGGDVVAKSNDPELVFLRSHEQEEYDRPQALAILDAMNQWVRQRHIPLIVMTTGWPHIAYPWMVSELNRRGIKFIDLEEQVAPVILGDQQRYIMLSNGHPTAEGAAAISDSGWPHLRPYIQQIRAAYNR